MMVQEPWWETADGFEWDEGNRNKNWVKHRVTEAQTEEVFSNRPALALVSIPRDSFKENRYMVLGMTSSGRELAVVFTERQNKIRVISARNMSRKERIIYEGRQEENS